MRCHHADASQQDCVASAAVQLMTEGWPLADIIRKRLTFLKSVKCHFLANYRAAFVSILKVGCYAALHVRQHHCIRGVDPSPKSVLQVPGSARLSAHCQA